MHIVFRDKPVRVVHINNEPWFVAKDLCDVLDKKIKNQAYARIDDHQKVTIQVRDPASGKTQPTEMVNEAGMCTLVHAHMRHDLIIHPIKK